MDNLTEIDNNCHTCLTKTQKKIVQSADTDKDENPLENRSGKRNASVIYMKWKFKIINHQMAVQMQLCANCVMAKRVGLIIANYQSKQFSRRWHGYLCYLNPSLGWVLMGVGNARYY